MGEEQDRLRNRGSREMFVKEKGGRRVFVIAGSGRNLTREAHIENQEALLAEL